MSHLDVVFEEYKDVFEVDLAEVHHFSDGVYAKQMTVPAGITILTHSHAYSHLSILSQGEVIVITDDDRTSYTAPACIEIKAHVKHAIHAVKDMVWFCIHATQETDPDKVDEVYLTKGT